MKKSWKLILGAAVILIIAFASRPLWQPHVNSTTRTTLKKTRTHQHERKEKAPAVTWGYPFKRLYEKKIKFESGQKFGQTDVMRRIKPKSYFHDGYDFGFSEVGHSPVLAVHAGIVHKVKYRPGMDLYVWVISPDGYVEVYQEGFLSITDIYVKKGEKVKLGQKIGKLTGSHIHLGITKTNKHYIDKHGDPCGNWWKNNGTWLNPMKIISSNLKAGQKKLKMSKKKDLLMKTDPFFIKQKLI